MITGFIEWVERIGCEYWLSAVATAIVHPEEHVTAELLWSGPAAQIERITIAPFGVVPLHRHPQVDSYEFPLWGEGEIWLNRHKYRLIEGVTPWRPLYISRRTWHGGCGYQRGGAFLSVQHWFVPRQDSIRNSWEDRC